MSYMVGGGLMGAAGGARRLVDAAYLVEATAAVDRAVTARLERHLCGGAALSAHCGEHLPTGSPKSAAVADRGAPVRPALRAAARLVRETAAGVEFLLAYREHELAAAIAAR